MHSVRAVIEAYSAVNKAEGRLGASANGIEVIGNTVRVTTSLGTSDYHIDRWD